MVCVARVGRAPGLAAQSAIGAQHDLVARVDRGDGHRAGRRGQASAGEQQAGQERFRQRRRDREPAGQTKDFEPLPQGRLAAAQGFRNPGEGYAGLLQRGPKIRRPLADLGRIDHLARGQIAHNTRRRLCREACFACHADPLLSAAQDRGR